ncbi:MAG: hypothetical protein IPO81_00225 [Kouleothrix sp.]|nr:hypothetical protein [Kouleothrix sp.]
MTDAQREERAIWKLAQAGCRVRPSGGGYLVTSPEHADELADRAALVAYAEAAYDRVWTGRKLTPSA